jgi:hypothetical protein
MKQKYRGRGRGVGAPASCSRGHSSRSHEPLHSVGCHGKAGDGLPPCQSQLQGRRRLPGGSLLEVTVRQPGAFSVLAEGQGIHLRHVAPLLTYRGLRRNRDDEGSAWKPVRRCHSAGNSLLQLLGCARVSSGRVPLLNCHTKSVVFVLIPIPTTLFPSITLHLKIGSHVAPAPLACRRRCRPYAASWPQVDHAGWSQLLRK